CLWTMATRMFLDPKKIEFTRECKAIQIPGGQEIPIPAGKEGVIKEIVDGSYIVKADKAEGPVRVAERHLDFLEPDPETGLIQVRLKRDCKAIDVHSGQKIRIEVNTPG